MTPEVTLSPKAAAEALNIDVFALKHYLRRAAVERLASVGRQIDEPARDYGTKLDYFDAAIADVRRLLVAAEACDTDWWGDIA